MAGTYSFGGVAVGNYTVKAGAGSVPTGPVKSNMTVTGLTLTTGIGSLSGNAYFDPADNNTNPPNNGPVPFFPFDLYTADGKTLLDKATTDASGNYDFGDLPAGDYLLHFHSSGNAVPDVGYVTPDGSSWAPVTVTNGQNTNLKEGFKSGGAIWGFVQSADGTLGAPSGITVNLLDQSGKFVEATTTDVNGFYAFNSLPVGTYQASVVPPSGQAVVDSAATLTRPLIAGEITQYTDFSLAKVTKVATGGISGTVSDDVSHNGVANATVILINTGTNTVVSTATTDAKGNYTLPNVLVGPNYKVVVAPPAGYTGETGPGPSVTGLTVTAGTAATSGVNIALKPAATSSGALDQTTPAPSTLTTSASGTTPSTVLNVVLRGQSNTYFPTKEGTVADMGKYIQYLLGFDGVNQVVNVVAVPQTADRSAGSEWSGTGLTVDWLTQNGGNYQNGWTANAIEQAYLSTLQQIPAADRGAPTAIVMLHNEEDSSLSQQSADEWKSAVTYEAGLARAVLGLSPANSPYLFVSPIPFNLSPGEPANNQAIAVGQAQLSADPSFNAKVVTQQSSDVTMDHDGSPGGAHLNGADQYQIYGRAALGVAQEFASLAMPGSPIAKANGNIDDHGPQVSQIQAVAGQPNQLLLTVAFDQASGLQALSTVAATGAGWTLRPNYTSDTPDASATAAAVVGTNQILLTFDQPVNTSDKLFYTWGSLRLQGGANDGKGNAVYDNNGLPLSVAPEGLSLAPGSSVLYSIAAPTIAGTVANQVTASDAPISPFAGVTISDSNASAIDTVTIALSGVGGALAGTGLIKDNDGLYELSGSAAAVTAALHALSFTPSSGQALPATTGLTLSVQSSAYATAATDATTSVVDSVATASTSTGGGSSTAPAGGTSTPTPTPPTTTPVATPPAPGTGGSPTQPSTGTGGPSPITGPVTNTGSTSLVEDSIAIAADPRFLGHGDVAISGTAASTAGVSAVEITATAGGVTSDLGAATIAPDGTFSFTAHIPAGDATTLSATLTDAAGATTTTAAPFVFTTGVTGQPYSVTEDHYDPATDAYTGTTYYRANTKVLYDSLYTSAADGTQSNTYSGGTYFKGKAFSSMTDTSDADGTWFEHSENDRDGTHAIAVLAPGHTVNALGDDAIDATGQASTSFVFQPGFGADVVTGFQAAGSGHDVLSFSSADFNSIAQVLQHTRDSDAGAIITDATTGDTVTLAGVTKADLKAHAGHDIHLFG